MWLLLRRYCETSARDVVSVVGAFETALQDALQRAYGLDPLAVSAYAHNADNTHYACNGVRDLVDDSACAHSVVPKRRCHCACDQRNAVLLNPSIHDSATAAAQPVGLPIAPIFPDISMSI